MAMGSDPSSLPRLNDLDTVVRAAPSEILDAIRRERENDAKADTKADAKGEEKVIVAPIADRPSDSSDVEVPQDKAAEPTSLAKVPIPLDPAALKPARVPQDFDKLMSQRAEGAVVPAKLPETANVDEGPMDPSPRRTKTVLSVIVVVLVVWLAILAAVAVTHFAGR
jgi:hypothetical protein